MAYLGLPEIDVSRFDGAITRLEPYSVPLNKALYAQNVAYLQGQCATRYGHTPIYTTTDGAITSMVNWFFALLGASVSVIAYYAPSVGLRTLNQLGPTVQTIMAVTGAAGAIAVPSAERLYVAFYDASGRFGFAGGQVYGWNIGSDPLFADPIANSIACSEPGAGVCTAGTRRIGYITTTRNGFTGNLQPVSGGVFTPFSFTSTGNKNIQVVISGAIPSYLSGGSIQIVATTTANLNRYFTVPGAVSNIPANPTTITFSISDNDLAQTGEDVTTQINFLTNSSGFKPCGIWGYSNRLCYAGISQDGFPALYISDPNNYQAVTVDQNLVQIEGQQQPVMGFSLRGVNYIGCTTGFYSNEDSGDVPVNWFPPQRVDGSIGIVSATCIYANPSAGYALIAAERGFYLFQGAAFPALPLSYYQDGDWSRINWSAATAVQIAEDVQKKEFIVSAPLNTYITAVSGGGPYVVTVSTIIPNIGAGQNQPHLYQTGLSVTLTGVTGAKAITVTGDNTFTITGGSGAPTVGGTVSPQSANAQMIWNYSDGDTADTVKYSIQGMASYLGGSVAVVKTLSTLLNEVYYAPNANGPIIKKNYGNEATPYRDSDMSGAAVAINCPYETALVPPPLQQPTIYMPVMTVHDYHGAHMSVRGVGNLILLPKGLNGKVTTVPARSPMPLQAQPPNEELVRWFLRSERQSLRISTNAVDSFFVLSLIRFYFSDAFPIR
jgi:hypothetical protein